MSSILRLILDVIVLMARLSSPNGKSLLIAEHLLVRQQLLMLRRKSSKAPRLSLRDRLVFAVAALFIRSSRLPKLSVVVAHSTLLKLYKALVNRKYSILFGNKSRKPGPKGPSQEVIKLIVEIKTKNPRYGVQKIALLTSQLLGQTIDEQLVRRILRKHYFTPLGPGPSWLSKIGIAKNALWSMDLFRCESILLQTYWVMVVIDQYTRQIVGFEVCRGALIGEDVCRMFASIQHSNGTSRHLSTDHDPLFRYHPWRANLRILGIDEINTIPEAPWSHPFIERAIGTVRREYLDDTLFWGEHDLKKRLDEFASYYNQARVHMSLAGKTPLGMSGVSVVRPIDLKNYTWKSYCGGRFSVPVAA
ncbi:MAG TPA: hypothetical protein DCS07_03405 [Bdellovibrionales bacterium]|nr:hypothetical protein [Bdellovibrionales bacterium]